MIMKTTFIIFTVLLVLWILCEPAFAGWEPLVELKAPEASQDAWFGYSVSTDGGFVAISAPWKDSYQGAVYIYEVNDLELDYVTTLLPPDLNDTDKFGYSVCIDSNKLVVGTYTAEEVYVFDYNGTEWSSNPEILSVSGSHDYFGTEVAIDNNTIVVGARGSSIQTGAAYVFDYNGVSWDYKQTLTDSAGANGDQFGYSLAVDSNVIVVGARWDDLPGGYREGSVLVFRLSGGTWSFEQKIENSGGSNSDEMGRSVAVSGDTFVAGVYSYDYGANGNAGAAFVYKWNGASWTKEATLYDPNADTSDRFGNSVAIDSNSIVVGEMYYGASNFGAAFLFERNGSSWSTGESLKDPYGAPNDYLGKSVAIDGEITIAGSYKDDGGETDSGAAFIFLLLIADLNRDGIVNLEDFAILANQWFDVPGNPSADIAPLSEGDNFVNVLDLKVFAEQWLRIGSRYIPSS
jgi:hypothetical protein